VIPALPSFLETLSEILNGNVVKDCRRFLLNLCNVSKVSPFQILLHPWVLKIVARSKVGQVGVVGNNHHFVFSQKLLDAVGMVIVMVQEPIPTLPLGGGFSS